MASSSTMSQAKDAEALSPVRVGLVLGKTSVLASALDWPGWCRRGKGEQAALDALLDYAGRYAVVAQERPGKKS